MSTGLAFDPEMSRGLELQYTRPAMVLRRAHALALADPKEGERVIDVGSGPGFLTADLGAGVGEVGEVLGIDQSEAMVELARRRCADWPQVRVEIGDAVALDAESGVYDLVVSTQVLEYVAEVDRALGEIDRVLRPGGRAVLLATDWRSVAWYSAEPERMDRMLSAWEEHLAHPTLPRVLGKKLGDLGLRVRAIDRHSIVERAHDRTGYARLMLGAIAAFAPGRRGVTDEEAAAWLAEQEALREEDAFHLSIGQYYFVAEKGPGD